MKVSQFFWRMVKDSKEYNPETSVDKIIIGNPEKDVKKALVTWICSQRAVEAAVSGGFDTIVTHEPTFWVHENEVAELEKLDDGSVMKQRGLNKKKLIEDNGITVVRIHDSWDLKPYYGMADSWSRFLGFQDKPVIITDNGFHRRHDIEPVPFKVLAQRIAEKTALVGEPMIQAIGDGDKIVSRICLAFGHTTDLQAATDMDCDVRIMADDGSLFWANIQCDVDADFPIIRVNHGTSEEPGVIMMTQYINENFPEIEAVHFPIRPYYRIVGNK